MQEFVKVINSNIHVPELSLWVNVNNLYFQKDKKDEYNNVITLKTN